MRRPLLRPLQRKWRRRRAQAQKRRSPRTRTAEKRARTRNARERARRPRPAATHKERKKDRQETDATEETAREKVKKEEPEDDKSPVAPVTEEDYYEEGEESEALSRGRGWGPLSAPLQPTFQGLTFPLRNCCAAVNYGTSSPLRGVRALVKGSPRRRQERTPGEVLVRHSGPQDSRTPVRWHAGRSWVPTTWSTWSPSRSSKPRRREGGWATSCLWGGASRTSWWNCGRRPYK